jgi:hypothetical protein
MTPIEAFLKEMDELWARPDSERITLRVIGSTALMMQTGYWRGTKDSDVLEAESLAGDTGRDLLALAGQGTALHRKHRFYLDIVRRGIPFLPQAPIFHAKSELNQELKHFTVEVLDIVDTVVSKLKRFNANDLDDVKAMIDLDLVPHARLLERFRSAVDMFAGDARAEDLPKYVRNLHRIERDMLFVEEARIELPAWIDSED